VLQPSPPSSADSFTLADKSLRGFANKSANAALHP